MLRDKLASIFRTLNTKLLYVNSWPVEKLLKVNLVISSKVYRKWMKQRHDGHPVDLLIDRNIKMRVDPSKAMGAAFYWMGLHELNEWRFLNRHLKAEMIFADIGANQGEFALFAAKRLSRGKVLAFEPVNIYQQQLAENISLNGFKNIDTFDFGLSDKSMQMPIYSSEEGIGENEGLASIFQSSHRNRLVQQIELKIFDDVIQDLKISRLDFMKIDVEGAELMVLRGARKTIEKYRPYVMLEVSEETYRAAGYSVSDVRSFFNSLGYSLNVITKEGGLAKAETVPSFCNVVFTPDY
ncbi:MAG: FkbM family methyltransferase [Chryseolinea sp.]